MKKMSLFVVALLLMFSMTAFAEAPAPFEYAKQYAMEMATPDKDGDYIVDFTFNENGTEIHLGFGYITNRKIIALGRSDLGAVGYFEENKSFVVTYGPFIVAIEEENAIAFAYVIYRDLVARDLLQRKK